MIPEDIITGNASKFLMIFLRMSVFLAFTPVIGGASLPGRFRIGLAVALAALLTPVVQLKAGSDGVAIMVLREVVFGMVLGLAVRFVFVGIEMGGQMVSFSMGMSIATIYNPEFGQLTDISQFLSIVATLIFLATDCHHELIALFARSFEWAPFGVPDPGVMVKEGIALVGRIFIIGVKVGAPIIVGTVTLNILLGFIVKATPQINIFFIGFPLYISLGFFIILLALPAYIVLIGGSFSEMRFELARIIGMAGR